MKGHFQVIVASPPCSTFSRARWANRQGPRPLRSAAYPRGFLRLTASRRKELTTANGLVDFAVELLTIQKEQGRYGLLEHPEDLGRHGEGGTPGSIWRWEVTKQLMDGDNWVSGSLRQSDWGRPYAKPTRLAGNLPGLDKILALGEPRFDDQGWYQGPLTMTADKPAVVLIGRNGDKFKTNPTAAWPEILCTTLASSIVDLASAKSTSPADGGSPPKMEYTMPRTSRRKITRQEWASLARGEGVEDIYVGRGGGASKVSRSPWANPFRIGKEGDRCEVINKYRHYAAANFKNEDLMKLDGRVLLCHCRLQDECHADVLIDMVKALTNKEKLDGPRTWRRHSAT